MDTNWYSSVGEVTDYELCHLGLIPGILWRLTSAVYGQSINNVENRKRHVMVLMTSVYFDLRG
jgi:hypothetical protein